MNFGISAVSEKGQVTIPKEIREYLGIKPGDKVLFMIIGERVILVKAGGRKVSEILRRQKPWKIGHVEFQKALRSEWI